MEKILLNLVIKRNKNYGEQSYLMSQSGTAAFNPAHRLINQTIESSLSHKLNTKETLQKDAVQLYKEMQLPNQMKLERDIHIKYLVVSYKGQ